MHVQRSPIQPTVTNEMCKLIIVVSPSSHPYVNNSQNCEGIALYSKPPDPLSSNDGLGCKASFKCEPNDAEMSMSDNDTSHIEKSPMTHYIGSVKEGECQIPSSGN